MAKSTATKYLESIIKLTGNPYAHILDNEQKHTGYISTGIYLLNALVSGSLYKGIPDNNIVTLAGPESTGKTMLLMRIFKHFLDADPNAVIHFMESESAPNTEKAAMVEFGVDVSRVIKSPVNTVQDVRYQALKVLELHEKTPEDERPKLLMALDSVGMLTTKKELEEASSGSDTQDMTRARLIKGIFRMLTLPLGRLNIPFIMTNHTYVEQKLYGKTKQSGGQGIAYASSLTLFLTTSKDKDSAKQITGDIIRCTTEKSRLTKRFKTVELKLNYNKGFDPYWGLLELAEKGGIVSRVGNKYEFPDGEKVQKRLVLADPTKYFTDELLQQLEEVAKNEFCYGQSSEEIDDEEENDD